MATELDEPRVYEELQLEENKNQRAGKKSHRRWVIPLLIALFGVVCFGAGFSAAHFGVPSRGRYCLGSKKKGNSIKWSA